MDQHIPDNDLNAYHNESFAMALKCTIGFVLLKALSIFTWTGVLEAIPTISNVVGLGVAAMAMRYYYYATKNAKRQDNGRNNKTDK